MNVDKLEETTPRQDTSIQEETEATPSAVEKYDYSLECTKRGSKEVSNLPKALTKPKLIQSLKRFDLDRVALR